MTLQVFRKIAAFFHKYDPGRFSFFYAIKALFALLVSLCTAKFIFDLNNLALIFLSLACMFIFFMNSFQSKGKKALLYLLLFVALSSAFLFCAKYMALLKVYMVIPTFLWVFIMSLAPLISRDLSKVGLFSTLYGFAILLIATQYGLHPTQVFEGLLIGSFFSVLIRTVSFTRYGSYTKKRLLTILDDLIYTCEYMPKPEFAHWRMSSLEHIYEMKSVFEAKSSTIKSSATIKHQEKALFYLYKCEEIAYSLIALRSELKKNLKRDKKSLFMLQDELIYNLSQLKLILNNKPPKLSFKAYDKLKQNSSFKDAHATLEVLYQKFKLFEEGGLRQIDLRPKSKITWTILKTKLNFENEIVRYAFKVALAVSLALFIANLFKLDHGIWISAFIFSIMRIKTSSVRVAGVQNLIGLFVGLGIGLVMILAFKGTLLYPFILLLAYFCAIYFTFFKPVLASIAITACLCIYYSVISSNYLNLVLIRAQDIFLSFSIAMIVSYFLWPSRSQSALYMMFLGLLKSCHDLLEQKDEDQRHAKRYALVEGLENFSKLALELKGSKSYKRFLSMQTVIENLNLGITNLQSQDTQSIQLDSDIAILLTRFKMLELKAKKRPFYFYPPKQLLKNLVCKDPKLRHSLYFIGLEQHRAYKIIKAT